jgi:Uma2 family endonuclease
MNESKRVIKYGEMQTDFDKPAVEWISGRAVLKVSPTRKHGKLQFRIGALLDRLGGGFGEVATEWTMHFPDEPKRTVLVPDVAFVAHARMSGFTSKEASEPPIAPDIAVEILSPSDRRRDADEKIALYLKHGSSLVLEVDPDRYAIVAHARDGVTTFGERDTFAHDAVPWLRFDIAPLFADLEFPR